MNNTETNTGVKITKETKNKIKVDFERTDAWTRFKIKYFSINFLLRVLFVLFRFVILVGISYVILFPFFSKISSSFMSKEDFVDVMVKLVPKYPTLDTYKAIIIDNSYFEVLLNTVLLSLLCGVLQTFICSLVGYGFAKFKFKGSKLVFAAVILTMIVPHGTVQLSMFMKFRYFDILGLFNLLGGGLIPSIKILDFTFIDLANSFWPLAILSLGGLGFKNGLYIFIMRQFFKGIPDELEESAYIDGSGTFRTFIQIILPLSVPMMMTIFLFAFSWQWTDNFYTEVFFTSINAKMMPSLVEVPKSLDTNYAGQNMYVAAIYNACAMLIVSPLIIVYLFCQRFLVQGIERSGIIG